MSDTEKKQRRKYPIVGADHYKFILHPAVEYDRVRRTTIFKDLGIAYVYGLNETDLGDESEVIEVWFKRTKWTVAGVLGWMNEHKTLPHP